MANNRSHLIACLLMTMAILAGPDPLARGDVREFESADELLEVLEETGVERLSADVRYTRLFALAGDTQTRTGVLMFEQTEREDAAALRRFAVAFDLLIVGRRKESETKRFVFDGEWLVEELPGEKLFIKRQIAAPGTTTDPLAIGEGPMPLPIGQKKDAILERFHATIVEAEDGLDADSLRMFVTRGAGSVQLRLIPKDVEELGVEEIRLWYDLESLLPRLTRTVDLDGDESIVQLLGVQTGEDAAVRDDSFDVTTPAVGSGWDVRVEPWRG